MKMVFAPDSFKGSLSAVEICALLDAAARRVFGDIDTAMAPVADGGEGTVDALLCAIAGETRFVTVTGPQGAPARAKYGLMPEKKLAVMEMAQASGLPLVDRAAPDVLRATSFGTGEMLRAALDEGAESVLIGIGGSATNDGGAGFLAALGAVFTDKNGKAVTPCAGTLGDIAEIDLSGLDKRLERTDIRVICDVTNPLLGQNGATYIYGPQKGVTPELCPVIDESMRKYADVTESATGVRYRDHAGAGAAGGLGFALGGVLGATLLRGVDAVLDTVGFEKMIEGADLVITAEGRMDKQSIEFGKVTAGVKERCERAGVPVIAIVGGMTKDAMAFCGEKASLMTTINGVMTLDEAMADASALFSCAAERALRMIRIGMDIA